MKKIVLLMLLAACAKTDSDDILTSGMHASITASTTGDGTTSVAATLFQGQPSQLIYVELTGDDQLIANHGSDTKVMTEIELLNVVHHHATFSTANEDDAFEVELRRTVDDGAPHSTVTLPVGFTLASPPTSSSRAAAINVSWSPAGSTDQMSWDATGDCIESAGGAISPGAGTLIVAADTFKKRTNMNMQQVPDSCMVTLNIERRRSGMVDTAFGKGGSFWGTQRRTVSFTSTP